MYSEIEEKDKIENEPEEGLKSVEISKFLAKKVLDYHLNRDVLPIE